MELVDGVADIIKFSFINALFVLVKQVNTMLGLGKIFNFNISALSKHGDGKHLYINVQLRLPDHPLEGDAILCKTPCILKRLTSAHFWRVTTIMKKQTSTCILHEFSSSEVLTYTYRTCFNGYHTLISVFILRSEEARSRKEVNKL